VFRLWDFFEKQDKNLLDAALNVFQEIKFEEVL
jgi:hypothetical protein